MSHVQKFLDNMLARSERMQNGSSSYWLPNRKPARVNPGFKGAFLKGVRAFKAGVPRYGCPYDAIATARVGAGRVVPTWSRTFANYWFDGWDAAKKDTEAMVGG